MGNETPNSPCSAPSSPDPLNRDMMAACFFFGHPHMPSRGVAAAGADLNAVSEASRLTPLAYAAGRGQGLPSAPPWRRDPTPCG